MIARRLADHRFLHRPAGVRVRPEEVIRRGKIVVVNADQHFAAVLEGAQVAEIPAGLIVVGDASIELRELGAPGVLFLDAAVNCFQPRWTIESAIKQFDFS